MPPTPITTVAGLGSIAGDFIFTPQSSWEASFSYCPPVYPSTPDYSVSAALLARCSSHAWLRPMLAGAITQKADITEPVSAGATTGTAVTQIAIPRTAIFAELVNLAASFAAPSFDVASVTTAQRALLNPRFDMDGNRIEGGVWGGSYRVARARGSVTLEVSWAPYKASFTIRP